MKKTSSSIPERAHDKRVTPIIVFADGACSGNPGPGGWACVIANIADDALSQIVELGGFEAETTNNKMEITAAGRALRFLEKTPGEVRLYTDSSYVIHGITKWVWGWQKKDWKKADGSEVANAEYWKRLMAILGKRKKDHGEGSKVEWNYVRGHSGVPGNERCDEIAVKFSRREYVQLYKGPLLKYDIPIMDLPDPEPVPEMKPLGAPKKEPYSYVSLVNGEVQRHKSWKECEARVKGRPGAKFKKTMSAEEEAEILRGWGK